jgi:hypothetical protein
MEIGLCWYQKGTNNKWTYNLTNHLMIDFRNNNYIDFYDLDAYELYARNENVFNNFINEC